MSGPPLRLLYAEDNPLDADLALTHFRRNAPDLELEVLGTGELCQERLARESFDLLLLDNHLPDIDGIEVLARLRAAGHKLPVVMLTVAGDEDSVARALLAGADDYVTKAGDYILRLPALLRDLMERVQRRASVDDPAWHRTRRVLYVEPHAPDADATLKHLATYAPHLRVHVITRCADALDLLTAASGFDLVMTDLRVPGMNAMEFYHEALKRGVDLPFIVITGHGDEQTAVALLRLGASDYIVKRDNYLIQLPHSIDHALHRFQLDRTTRRLHGDLAALNRTLEQRVEARTAELQREIKERRRVEGALRDSENNLAVTLQSIGDAVIATDAAGRVTRMNPMAERLTAWTLEEASGMPLQQIFRIVSAETRTPVKDPVERVLAQGEIAGLANHTTLLARDDREYQIANTAAPIRDAEGRVCGVVLVFKDVTEEYRFQRILADREKQLSLITDALPGPVTRVSREGRYLFANAAFANWFGKTASDIVGRHQLELMGSARLERAQPYIRRVEAGERVTYEATVRTTPNGPVHAMVTLIPDSDGDGVQGGHISVVTDITERRNAEEKLQKSEALLRIAGRTARLGGWALDLPQMSLTWTDEVCDIHEVPAGHVLEIDGALEFVAPEARDAARRALEACVRDGSSFDLQFEIITAKSRRLWVRSTGEAERDGAGAISRVQGALQDIDAQKRSEKRISDQLAELLRWQSAMVDRQGRAQELKTEVNELLRRLNLPPRYGNPTES